MQYLLQFFPPALTSCSKTENIYAVNLTKPVTTSTTSEMTSGDLNLGKFTLTKDGKAIITQEEAGVIKATLSFTPKVNGYTAAFTADDIIIAPPTADDNWTLNIDTSIHNIKSVNSGTYSININWTPKDQSSSYNGTAYDLLVDIPAITITGTWQTSTATQAVYVDNKLTLYDPATVSSFSFIVKDDNQTPIGNINDTDWIVKNGNDVVAGVSITIEDQAQGLYNMTIPENVSITNIETWSISCTNITYAMVPLSIDIQRGQANITGSYSTSESTDLPIAEGTKINLKSDGITDATLNLNLSSINAASWGISDTKYGQITGTSNSATWTFPSAESLSASGEDVTITAYPQANQQGTPIKTLNVSLIGSIKTEVEAQWTSTITQAEMQGDTLVLYDPATLSKIQFTISDGGSLIEATDFEIKKGESPVTDVTVSKIDNTTFELNIPANVTITDTETWTITLNNEIYILKDSLTLKVKRGTAYITGEYEMCWDDSNVCTERDLNNGDTIDWNEKLSGYSAKSISNPLIEIYLCSKVAASWTINNSDYGSVEIKGPNQAIWNLPYRYSIKKSGVTVVLTAYDQEEGQGNQLAQITVTFKGGYPD